HALVRMARGEHGRIVVRRASERGRADRADPRARVRRARRSRRAHECRRAARRARSRRRGAALRGLAAGHGSAPRRRDRCGRRHDGRRTMTALLVVVASAAVIFSLRSSLVIVFGARTVPPGVRRASGYVLPAMMSALAAGVLVSPKGGLPDLDLIVVAAV